jgi:hypothetical protein
MFTDDWVRGRRYHQPALQRVVDGDDEQAERRKAAANLRESSQLEASQREVCSRLQITCYCDIMLGILLPSLVFGCEPVSVSAPSTVFVFGVKLLEAQQRLCWHNSRSYNVPASVKRPH